MKLPEVTKTGIDLFITFVESGIECWVLAGQKIVRLKKERPDVFKDIIRAAPWISTAVLESFHRIGEGSLSPKALLLPPRQAAIVAGLSRAEQDAVLAWPDALARIKKMRRPQVAGPVYPRVKPSTPRHSVASGPSVAPANSANTVSAGFYRITFKFGKPALVPIPRDAAQRNLHQLHRITLGADMAGEPEAFIELLRHIKIDTAGDIE